MNLHNILNVIILQNFQNQFGISYLFFFILEFQSDKINLSRKYLKVFNTYLEKIILDHIKYNYNYNRENKILLKRFMFDFQKLFKSVICCM